MKKTITLCLLLVASIQLWSQNDEFIKYEIDTIVSVNLPGEISKTETPHGKKTKILLTAKSGISQFNVEKNLFESDSIGIYESNLPYDLESLKVTYKNLAKEYVQKSNLKFISEAIIENGEYTGYHITFNDENGGIFEVSYFLLNKYIYVFSYKNYTGTNKADIDSFFDSISINSLKNIRQFIGKSPTGKTAYSFGYKIGRIAKTNPAYLWIGGGIILILLIGFVVFIVKKTA